MEHWAKLETNFIQKTKTKRIFIYDFILIFQHKCWVFILFTYKKLNVRPDSAAMFIFYGKCKIFK